MEEGNEEAQGADAGGNDDVVADLKKQIAELNRENAERRTTSNSVSAELEKFKADKLEDARLAAEKKGEFEALYQAANGELSTVKEQAASLTVVISSYLDKEIEKVPEDKREAIPNLPDAEKLEWLQTHGQSLFGAQQTPGPGIKEQGKETSTTLQAQYEKAFAAGMAGDKKQGQLAMVLKRKIHEASKNN